MVSIINSNQRNKTVDVTLNINDVYDILNGLFIMEGQKETDLQEQYADATDKQQLQRYKILREKFQQIKNLIK